MQYVIYVAAGIFLLGVCIFVHELGHLLGGKMVGIKARVFSIGFGKGIIKKTVGDTTYQIAPIPLGGYCQFYGEDPSEERAGKEYEFLSAAPWRRIVTVAMGPLFNLFFGILIFLVMNMVGYSKETNRVSIPDHLRQGKRVSPAYEAGIRTGDRIVGIGGKDIRSFPDIQTAVFFGEGVPTDVAVERDGTAMRFTVTPRLQEESGRHEIGVVPYGTRILVAGLVKDGPAASAGLREMDEIVSADDVVLKSEAELTRYVGPRAGKPITLEIVRKGKPLTLDVTPVMNEEIVFSAEENGDGARESIPLAKTPALQNYLGKGLVTINGRKVGTFKTLADEVRKSRGGRITLGIENETYTGTARVDRVGRIGVYQAMAPDQVLVRYGPGRAVIQAVVEPYEFIALNLKALGMFFTGKLKVRENLSGPIRIVQIAGQVAYYKGIPDFILLMAKISIILMVMNLLPIPVVDGSQIVFFLIEIVRKKPLSQKVMERIQTVGVALLIMLGAFVIVNDISMLPFIQNLFR